MLLPILEEIQRYTCAVAKKEVHCDLESCPRCGKRSSFKLHDRRERTYLVRLERLVKTVLSLLSRWKCVRCGETFTLYPDFALPGKRYLKDEILERSRRYVEEEGESYRSAVKVSGLGIFHEGQDGEIDERSLAHTTLYHWLALSAALKTTAREALRLLREKSPRSRIFREIRPIAPWKYRSEKRRELLGETRRLLLAEGEYRALFGLSIFPRLATACAWS